MADWTCQWEGFGAAWIATLLVWFVALIVLPFGVRPQARGIVDP
jgi:predicted secreted protein